MIKCSFCGFEVEKGTGKMFVKTDSTIFYFCSMKCEKNMLKLRRIPRNVKWTTEARQFKGKTIKRKAKKK